MAEEKVTPESFEIDELDDAALEEGVGGNEPHNTNCVPNDACRTGPNT